MPYHFLSPIFLLVLFSVTGCQNDKQHQESTSAESQAPSKAHKSHKHQQGHSPYAGQQNRDLKAFPPKMIKQLKKGSGMPFYGMAKPAELNSYPGPKHLLQGKDTLALTPNQISQIQELYDTMHKQAVATGQKLLSNERKLDSAFAANSISPKELDTLMARSGKLYGKLRHIHLKAHLKAKKVLSKNQINTYDRWRGYGK
jgi:hypothetical protein